VAGERILVVDDEPGVRAALAGILRDEGYGVVAVGSGEDGLATAGEQAFDLVLLDVWLPGIDGLETLRQLRERGADAEVVMISGHGTIETAVRATKLGAFDFVEKPLSLDKTLLVLRNALRQRRLEQRNRRLLEQLGQDTEVVGSSAAAVRLRREIAIAAASDAALLVSGEPGSGRERVARRLHAAGRSPDGPFVEVPCGTLDAATAARVLFGEPPQPGRVDRAAGGTLFVENAERLAPGLQQRLAERLRDGACRVIASTAAEPTGLDPELLRAVDVLRIRVPALRERREDIEPLAQRAMGRLAREYSRPAKRLGAETLAVLRSHAWPGNLRELENLMERLLLFAPGESIEVRDLPESLGGTRAPGEDLYRAFGSLAEGVRAFERYFVARVLAEEPTDRDAAARRLGIGRDELERRLGER